MGGGEETWGDRREFGPMIRCYNLHFEAEMHISYIYDDHKVYFSPLLLSMFLPASEAPESSLRGGQDLQACAPELISKSYYPAAVVLVLATYL